MTSVTLSTAACARRFLFELDVHPSTLALHTSLGNLLAAYDTLAPDNPHRTICSLRPGTEASLIDVRYRAHDKSESYSEPRLPDGVNYASLVARLSTVQIVFMQRFLNEFLDYLAVMFAMQVGGSSCSCQARAALACLLVACLPVGSTMRVVAYW